MNIYLYLGVQTKKTKPIVFHVNIVIVGGETVDFCTAT